MTKAIKPDEAKQRMREYLKGKGIPHNEAEVTCGYKRGYLSAGGVVGSDKLACFISAYPDCDIYYIITGRREADPRIWAIKKLLEELEKDTENSRKRLRAATTLVTNMVT